MGGAFPFKKNGSSFYIMIKIDGDTLDRINERRAKLGLLPKTDIHMTLLHLHVNTAHPDFSTIFDNPAFYDIIRDSIIKNLITTGLIFDSPLGSWDLLGLGGNEFWARIYTASDIKNISKFRMDIFNYINGILGPPTLVNEKRGKGTDIDDFSVYSYGGHELYAINQSHYNIKTWRPHISVLNIRELTPRIRSQIDNQLDKSTFIRETIGGPVKPISEIIPARDTHEFRLGTPWNTSTPYLDILL